MYAKVLKPFGFILVVMAVVSLACLGGGGTPEPASVTEAPQQVEEPQEPTPTEPPVQTEEPVATEAPAETEAPPAAEALDFFTEEFDGSNENWSFFVIDGSKRVPVFVDDKLGDSSLYTEDGLLVFDLTGKYQWVYTFYDPYEYKNVALEVVADNRGVNDNNISLICRYTESEGWYEFNIANNGLYWILYGKVDTNGNVIYTRMADGGSNRVKQGKEVNTYAITCEDRNLTLYINGKETRKLEDNRFVLREGKIGVSISSFNALPVKVEIQSVDIREP